MTHVRPSKEALAAEYLRCGSDAATAKVYSVSERTVFRWRHALGIKAHEAPKPERRRGGRRYKRTGKAPQHVTHEQARELRALHAAHPTMKIAELKARTGATCSRAYVQLILRGKRITAPEAFPPKAASPAPTARLTFARVAPRT